MDNKAKIIIIGLAAVLLACVFIAFKTYSEKERLAQENKSLEAKVEESLADNRRLQDKVRELNRQSDDLRQQLEGVARERDEIQKKIVTLSSEREMLIKQLKAQKTEQPAAQMQVPGARADDAYWENILKAKANMEVQLESLRTELKNVQTRNDQLQREKNNLVLEMNNIDRQKQDLQRQLDYNQRMVDVMAKELVKEKNDKLKINDTLKTVRGENASIRRQVIGLTNRKTNLETKIAQLQEEKGNIENRLGDMETVLKDQIARFTELNQRMEGRRPEAEEKTEGEEVQKEGAPVELPPIVVRPSQAESLEPEEFSSTKGGILAINKDNNFVIVDMGEDLGLRLGATLQVYRDNRPIGTVEVIQLRKTISACDIKKETTPFRVGDKIR
jgi:chromosome segregation ATPase